MHPAALKLHFSVRSEAGLSLYRVLPGKPCLNTASLSRVLMLHPQPMLISASGVVWFAATLM